MRIFKKSLQNKQFVSNKESTLLKQQYNAVIKEKMCIVCTHLFPHCICLLQKCLQL